MKTLDEFMKSQVEFMEQEFVPVIEEESHVPWNKTWNRILPLGSSKTQHYSSIKDVMSINKEKQIPNGIIITSDMMPVFIFCPEFSRIDYRVINGPYFCGYWEDTIPVVCTPQYAYDDIMNSTISIQYTDHEDIIKDLYDNYRNRPD